MMDNIKIAFGIILMVTSAISLVAAVAASGPPAWIIVIVGAIWFCTKDNKK
jgi:hypothetical protein